eukprot:3770790-Pyramimonas_sp.AAC.1
MATPALPAALVRSQLPPELKDVPDYEMVCPCCQRLPMGSSHSVHILMSINVRSLGETLNFNRKLA